MELTDIQTAIIICIYLFGVVSCRFATQFFEVCHTARLVQRTMYHCLLMCAKVHEDVAFLEQIKQDHLEKSDFDKERIHEFMKVDKQIMDNWKQSVIQSIVINTPRTFSFVTKFATWGEAMHQLDEMRKEE